MLTVLDLHRLIRARAILDKTYCKWTTSTGDGKHCAMGALHIAAIPTSRRVIGIQLVLNSKAVELHPELQGRKLPRDIPGLFDYFDENPVVFINNHLGKEAILEVFDSAIYDLEEYFTQAKPRRYNMDAFDEVMA